MGRSTYAGLALLLFTFGRVSAQTTSTGGKGNGLCKSGRLQQTGHAQNVDDSLSRESPQRSCCNGNPYTCTAVAFAGCLAGQPSYAGDWAREGVRVSMVKTGDDNSCSRYVTLEMVDELRFHSNPWVESLAIIVNVSGSGQL